MSISKKSSDIAAFYEKHKAKVIITIIFIVLIGLAIQLYLYYYESMHDYDIRMDSIEWSETCAGKIYTVEEKSEFCSRCYNDPGFECRWPLDMNIFISRVDSVRATAGEVHCFFIIDNINYYTEKGSFYGLENNSLFTWQLLLANADHDVQFCCGINRESALATIFGLDKDLKQACISRHIIKRCGPEYAISNISN